MEEGEEVWLDEAAFLLAGFGPGVGEEDEAAVDLSVGEALHHLAGIIHVEANILEPGIFGLAERFGHAIDEGLAAKETCLWVERGLAGQVFAATKTDLKSILMKAMVKPLVQGIFCNRMLCLIECNTPLFVATL